MVYRNFVAFILSNKLNFVQMNSTIENVYNKEKVLKIKSLEAFQDFGLSSKFKSIK